MTGFKNNDLELREAVVQAEQMLRFFMKRDEMNAEVHMNMPVGVATADQPSELPESARVRYSPITYAAQMLVTYLWKQLYEEPPLSIVK